MDLISIKHLHLDFDNIDYDKSYKSYNVDTCYHNITLYLIKDKDVKCPYCNSNEYISKSTKANECEYSVPNEYRIHIKIYRHVYKCSKCNKTYKQDNPLDKNF